MIYLFIKYDEKFCTLLLGHFRNIPHLESEYQSTYPAVFKDIIKTYIDDRRTRYDSFTEVQTNIDSVTIENNPSITSTEHILHPTNKYTCMGDLYESHPELMKNLIICEFFDKNHHMYGDNQNYIIKRYLRDKIDPAKITKQDKHSDKILGFTLILGGTKSAQHRQKKKFVLNQFYFTFSRPPVNKWSTLDALSKNLKKFKLHYVTHTYLDNDLVGISTTIKRTNDSSINIKLLDKKTKITTLKGQTNRKEATTGIVCKSGPGRMQINRLQKDIELILQSTLPPMSGPPLIPAVVSSKKKKKVTLNYNTYIQQLKGLFTTSNIPTMQAIISESLQLYIDGINNDNEYEIPENIPIINYKKKPKKNEKNIYPYKKIYVNDLCIIISTLLRFKEYEPMFYLSKTFTPTTKKWFYNNNESNNKYIDIFNK